MSFQTVLDERKVQLGAQMFQLVSAKVLMLLDSGQMDARSFGEMAKAEGITDLGSLRDGFLRECSRHHLSRNEAEYLFASTKRLVESKMKF
ncbi:hypothetical protein [Gorillibacterium sp. sgz500922]|uniref:hypothetical protein n=1 Tax=Gorillibacterium sp. sgz500922 TaxID=3446694 RepID=UPI003F665195